MLKRSKYGMPPAQNFADPGMRQMELDAFEQQRQAYNDEMTRLMAKGGEVTEDPQDKAARSIVKDFESYGYTKEEIMELADQVAAAGRGGDELLAYLSPESVRFLKENGGSGTINPVTGLSEFKGGFVGQVVKKIENAFSPSSSGTSSLDMGEQAAKDTVAILGPLNGPVSPQQAADRAELEARQRGAKAQPAFVPPTVAADSPYYSSPEYMAYVKANSGPGGLVGTTDMYDSPYFGTVGSGGLGRANDRAYESYLGRLAQESKQREQDAADAAARAQAEREAAAARERMIAVPVIGAPAPPTARDQLEQMPAPPMAPPPYTEPPTAPPQLTPIAPPPLPTPRARNAVPEFISRAPENTSYTPPVLPGQIRLPGMGGSASQFAADIPISMPAMPSYTSRGIGAVGPVNAATSNYFAMTPQTSTGLAPGSAAIGSPDMPIYGAMNTMNAMGSNPNLSPTMLGGAQNAGFFMDRMGNRITAPGMAPYRPFGFAKGGDVDLKALMAQNAETLSDEEPEEVINTDPVGTAQKMLADLSGANKPSPTRQAIKRTKTSSGDGAEADKAMQLAYEDLAKGDLGAMKDRAPAARNTESARSQMEELARIYQLKIRAAQQQARGLSADTFGAPTLEGPTLTKNRLTKNRFKEGGEAKKSDAFNRAKGSPEEGEESSDGFYAPFFRAALGIPEEGETSITDQLIGAGETALTLGSGALSSAVGMPYGLYKGLTSGKYLEGKAPQIADKEAADFIERNTYVPRSQSGKENLEALSKITDALKLAPTPGGAAMASLARPKAVQAQAANIAEDFQEYNRQLDVPGASYAVRPTGSTMLTGPVGSEENISYIDRILRAGMVNATSAAGQNQGQAGILQDFWDKKARNYFTRQFGTPDDPVAKGIANKQIKGAALEGAFPEYMLDSIAIGKKRVREGDKPENFVGPGAPDSRFFPKYPRAMDDFTTAYDRATNLKGIVITSDPAAVHPTLPTLLSPKGKELSRTAQTAEEDKMSMQGLRPEMINANVGTVAYSPSAEGGATADQSLSSSKAMLDAYRTANTQKPSLFDRFFGMNNQKTANNMLSQNVITAIDKGEPVYDIKIGLGQPLHTVLDPASINKYLASLPPREAANIRFEDAVAGGLKLREQADQRRIMIERITSGKPVADSVFSEGVSAPLLQFEEGPSKGFAWKRIEKREATIPEGAYIGHSVGGFEMGGPGYPTTKREAFNTGKYEVYTLRDTRNRPVTTIEVTMMDEVTPVVTQIKGDGRATGNVPAATHEGAVLRFLEEYLRPAEIVEKDKLLTPALKKYKRILRPDAPDESPDEVDFI